MTFGLQIQMMLVAPAAVKRSWTCRQARANSPGRLPLACSDHGYQEPFHLVVEAEAERQAELPGRGGPPVDVGVEVTVDDARQPVPAVDGVVGSRAHRRAVGAGFPGDDRQHVAAPGVDDRVGAERLVPPGEEGHRARRLAGRLGQLVDFGHDERGLAGEDAVVALGRPQQGCSGGSVGQGGDVGRGGGRGRPSSVHGQVAAGDPVVVAGPGGAVQARGVAEVGQVGPLGVLLPAEVPAVAGGRLARPGPGRLRLGGRPGAGAVLDDRNQRGLGSGPGAGRPGRGRADRLRLPGSWRRGGHGGASGGAGGPGGVRVVGCLEPGGVAEDPVQGARRWGSGHGGGGPAGLRGLPDRGADRQQGHGHDGRDQSRSLASCHTGLPR